MSERLKGLDAYEFANLRHDYSEAYVKGDIQKTDGFLTTGERKLCKEYGMVLPKPVKPRDLDNNSHLRIYDLDWWMCRIGATVDGDPAFGVWQREKTWNVQARPAYIVDGSFDVVHGGHWSLTNAAVDLAVQNGGYLYFLIQPNKYIMDYKNKLPIFDEITRVSWFREHSVRVDGAVVWDEGKSWETGYETLGRLMGQRNKKNVFFVLPNADSLLPHKEGYLLLRRELQIKDAGFSVEIVKNTYIGDVSSSKLRHKFNLFPTKDVLLWQREQG